MWAHSRVAVTRHLSEHSDQQLRDRRARGLDRFDEVWNGELHMNPSPSPDHQRIASRLVAILTPLADAANLEVFTDLDVLDRQRGDNDYRQPDVSVVEPGHTNDRGIVGGCRLAIEVRSPRDETYLKFDFYAANEVQQLLVIDPATRLCELYELAHDRYTVVPADEEGRLTIAALPVSFETITDDTDPVLRISWPQSSFDV